MIGHDTISWTCTTPGCGGTLTAERPAPRQWSAYTTCPACGFRHEYYGDPLPVTVTPEQAAELAERTERAYWPEPSQPMPESLPIERIPFGQIRHRGNLFGILADIAKSSGLALALALTLHAPTLAHEANGHTDTLPIIGTPAYDAGCTITGAWEDGSATAYCPEDGASYVYDPDGDITTGKQPGWYPR